MRYITIPEPLLVMLPGGTASVTLSDVVKGLLSDQRTTEMFDRASRKTVRRLPWDGAPGSVVEVDDDAWGKLEQIVRAPRLLTAVLDADADAGDPMLGAIADAPTKDPRSK